MYLHLSKIKLLIFLNLQIIFESSYCGSYIPKDAGTCTHFTNSQEICCFLRGAFNGQYHSMCYPFSRATYYKLGRSVKINGFTYRLDCGSKRGATCGDVVNPKTYNDCGVYSNKKNSCCLYSYYANSTVNETNCVWLGTSDIGIITYYKTVNDTGTSDGTYLSSLQVICDSKFLWVNFGILALCFIGLVL